MHSVLLKAVLALGSNKGDRSRFLAQACQRLESSDLRVLRRSALYFTRPAEGASGGAFTNAVLLVETRLRPRALLHRCQQVERDLGRVRRERSGSRTVDIDIIFYGNLKLSTPELTIPHPRWSERDFVIVPLLELGYAPGCLDLGRAIDSVARSSPNVERHILRKQEWPRATKTSRRHAATAHLRLG